MHDLLLEVFLEEVPAGFMPGILADLKKKSEEALKEARLGYRVLKTLGTPRRLTLIVEGLDEAQETLIEEVRGPSLKIAYQEDGTPSRALEGFMRGQGLTVEDLEEKEHGGSTYIFAMKRSEGKKAKDILPDLLQQLIIQLHFPKTMRWGAWQTRYVRPIHHIVALLDDEVVPFSLEMLHSDRLTEGHRFLSQGLLEIPNVSSYESSLEKAGVIVSPEKRRESIQQQFDALAKEGNYVFEKDEQLFSEVLYLVEYPTALVGSFDPSYLSLPEELVVTPMRDHQRYFAVRDDKGKLLPHFLTVRNGTEEHLDVVRRGNEKVLEARLADAKFFYEEDLKHPLSDNLEQLKKIVFQEKLGTVYEKTERLMKNAKAFAGLFNLSAKEQEEAVEAARLSKADLVSQVVTEFPELQGIIGEEYVRKTMDLSEAVAVAVREHYAPRFAGDAIPATDVGAVASLADKMDTIVGCFLADIEPTGSQDPYALRRQALAVVRILVERHYTVSLSNLIKEAISQYPDALVKTHPDVAEKVLHFFEQRVLTYLRDAGYEVTFARAMMAPGYDEVSALWQKTEALHAYLQAHDATRLIEAWKRADNLASKAEPHHIDEAMLEAAQEADQQFYASLCALEDAVKPAYAEENYEKVLTLLEKHVSEVERFFDRVMIMDKDMTLRTLRLAMLQRYTQLGAKLVDFSAL